uniref:Uncharacterized protein n=1 Tax=Streptomyces sp. 44030 TaxID=364102 RepID=Q2LEW8_9ACTN|nr:hypothetical protein [Streptomyces sp. 44030]ABC67347.1 hypothetical protein pRL1.18 [Streptomyces sp. 44030]
MTATMPLPFDVVVEPLGPFKPDVVVEHSADPDYWTVYVPGHDGLIYNRTLATADLAHLRDVDHVRVTDRRTREPWSVR